MKLIHTKPKTKNIRHNHETKIIQILLFIQKFIQRWRQIASLLICIIAIAIFNTKIPVVHRIISYMSDLLYDGIVYIRNANDSAIKKMFKWYFQDNISNLNELCGTSCTDATQCRDREVGELALLRKQNEEFADALEYKSNAYFKYITTRIVHVSTSDIGTTFIIGIGSDDGISIGSAVVNARGLLGKIINMYKHYARVLPVGNQNMFVSVIFLPSNVKCIVGGKQRYEDDIGKVISIKACNKEIDMITDGEIAVTAGDDNAFPYGIVVGTSSVNKGILTLKYATTNDIGGMIVGVALPNDPIP